MIVHLLSWWEVKCTMHDVRKFKRIVTTVHLAPRLRGKCQSGHHPFYQRRMLLAGRGSDERSPFIPLTRRLSLERLPATSDKLQTARSRARLSRYPLGREEPVLYLYRSKSSQRVSLSSGIIPLGCILTNVQRFSINVGGIPLKFNCNMLPDVTSHISPEK